MLDYEYEASLHISHPVVSPDVISKQLRRKARRQHTTGDVQRSPVGAPVGGTYVDNYWTINLEPIDGQDIVQFVDALVAMLAPHREFLRELSDTGGEVGCFIGISTARFCPIYLTRRIIGEFGDPGIDLMIELYGSEPPQRELK